MTIRTLARLAGRLGLSTLACAVFSQARSDFELHSTAADARRACTDHETNLQCMDQYFKLEALALIVEVKRLHPALPLWPNMFAILDNLECYPGLKLPQSAKRIP